VWIIMSQPSSGAGLPGSPEAQLLALTCACVRDRDDRITLWTEGMERLYGWPQEEALGQVSHTLLRTEFPRPLESIRVDLLRDGEWQGEVTQTRRDGGRLLVASQWVLHRDDTGRPQGTLELNHDLTALLARADRRRDEYLALLAHELRNPLAPILTAVEVIKRLSLSGTELVTSRDIIERQARQLARLLDDLLDVSRVTLGKLPLHKEVVEVRDVVGRAFEVARPLIDARGHTLTVRLPRRPLRLEADPLRLAQALANLLTNAAKFMGVGGQIWLAVQHEGGDVVFCVRDRGIGIPREMLVRVFDLFTQAAHSPDRPPDGLGVGLALVRSLVELHGGSVQALSEGPGKGSEFILRLPALPGDGNGARAVEAPG
jgi:PAS domain S-box-containing protein